jgi:hypothetical protein
MIRDRQPGDYLECPTINCEYYSLRKEEEIERHDCPRCDVSYCFTCETVYHDGETCGAYQAKQRAKQQAEQQAEQQAMQQAKQRLYEEKKVAELERQKNHEAAFFEWVTAVNAK